MSYKSRSAIMAALAVLSTVNVDRFRPNIGRRDRMMANKILQFGGHGSDIHGHNKGLYKRWLKRQKRNKAAKLSRRINRGR